MQINLTYQSVSSPPSGFVDAMSYVVNVFNTTFTGNLTVNIDVGFDQVDGQRRHCESGT